MKKSPVNIADYLENELRDSVENILANYGSVSPLREFPKDAPRRSEVEKMMNLLRTILFPGFYGERGESSQKLLLNMLIKVVKIFVEEYVVADCFSHKGLLLEDCECRANKVAVDFLRAIPYILEMLFKDAEAAYVGDPACQSLSEAILCYPCFMAMTHHRVSHLLYDLEVPLIPRMISELAHNSTGIDIHPGARIGESFFIDHGTGVVIGETSEIGSRVKIYQGVTLGAKSFPLDKNGHPIKGIPRHPIIEDDVIIYANATILGRIRVGKGAVIGGNTWVTEDVPAGAKIYQHS